MYEWKLRWNALSITWLTWLANSECASRNTYWDNQQVIWVNWIINFKSMRMRWNWVALRLMALDRIMPFDSLSFNRIGIRHCSRWHKSKLILIWPYACVAIGYSANLPAQLSKFPFGFDLSVQSIPMPETETCYFNTDFSFLYFGSWLISLMGFPDLIRISVRNRVLSKLAFSTLISN